MKDFLTNRRFTGCILTSLLDELKGMSIDEFCISAGVDPDTGGDLRKEATEKDGEKEEALFLNLFWEKEDYETTRIIYVTESDIYYIKYYEFDQYDIARFDLKQMEEHILYRYRDSQAKGYNYLGIIPEPDHVGIIIKNVPRIK